MRDLRWIYLLPCCVLCEYDSTQHDFHAMFTTTANSQYQTQSQSPTSERRTEQLSQSKTPHVAVGSLAALRRIHPSHPSPSPLGPPDWPLAARRSTWPLAGRRRCGRSPVAVHLRRWPVAGRRSNRRGPSAVTRADRPSAASNRAVTHVRPPMGIVPLAGRPWPRPLRGARRPSTLHLLLASEARPAYTSVVQLPLDVPRRPTVQTVCARTSGLAGRPSRALRPCLLLVGMST